MSRDQFWKPDEVNANELNKVKFVKNKRKNKRSKVNSKKKRSRNFCLYFFRLNKYSSDISIAYVISQKYGMPMPDRDNVVSFIIAFWELHKNDKKSEKAEKQINSDKFYSSKKWKEVRYIALSNSEGCCSLCGASAKDGVQIHVDHIKPRSLYPEFSLDLDNLQILCSDCNIGKSNFDEKDWRY